MSFAVASLSLAHAAVLPLQPLTKAGFTQDVQAKSSAHFTIIWRNIDAAKMATYPAGHIDTGLANMERIWSKLVDTLKFPYYPLSATPKKTNVYLNPAKYAWGAGSDVGGEIEMHPDLVGDPWVVAHEFTHSLQTGSYGFRGTKYVGTYWEAHANWMAHQFRPQDTRGAVAYVRGQELYFGSTRQRYVSWPFFEYLKDEQGGVATVTKTWLDWPAANSPTAATEDFMSALMRTKGWSQAQLNDVWGGFALRMAGYDFKNPVYGDTSYFLSFKPHFAAEEQTRRQWVRLDAVDTAKGRYSIPFYLAPQRFAQNVVRLHPDAGKDTIVVNFQGDKQAARTAAWVKRTKGNEYEPDTVALPGSDWRWGLVAINPTANGGLSSFRYVGPFAADKGDGTQGAGPAARIVKQAGETQFYLVVAATPSVRQLIMWDQMYYSIYRYPWKVQVRGARPEGFQPGAWAAPAGVAGAKHSNGGGWVASSAKVAATAYVAPGARVLDKAQVLDFAQILGNATVRDNAIVKENAVVRDRALVRGDAVVSGTATVKDDASVTAGKIHGNATIKELALIRSGEVSVPGSAVVGGVGEIGVATVVSGTAQILGDHEYWASSVDKGVFYGFIDNAVVANATMGASRTAPVPEVTAVPNFAWTNAAPSTKLSVSATSLLAGKPLTLTASATDIDGSLGSLQILVDGAVAGSGTASSLQKILSNLSIGNHAIQARATDNEGAIGTSAAVTVSVTWNYALTVSAASNWFGGLTVTYALPANVTSASVQVLNSAGTTVRTANVAAGSVRTRFTSVSGLPAGAYTLRLVVNGTIAASKAVVKL